MMGRRVEKIVNQPRKLWAVNWVRRQIPFGIAS
jgi:hypothetical protein